MKIKENFFKKIKKILIIIFLSFFSINTFAENIEDVFSDINPDFNYYSQLQTLYNNGIIKKTKDGLFEPGKVLTRDEFIGILEEVNCNKCIMPDVSEDLKNNISSSGFFDIGKTNKYFYCIADAKKKGITTGYDVGHTCDDGTRKDGERPFCPNNNIRLEEAVAMLFRSAGIFSIQDANKVIEDINRGLITEELSSDVKPTLGSGKAYSFYGDLEKALNYYIDEYDENGNKKSSVMLKKDSSGLIHPEKNITKSDFVNLAYVIFKTNSCINGVKTGDINMGDGEYGLGTNIKMFEKDCDIMDLKNCKIALFDGKENTFDFYGEVGGVCNKGVKRPDGYRWEFFNETTGERQIKLGKIINNYSFIEEGIYNISLQVFDNCGNIGKANFYFNYSENNFLNNDEDWIVSEVDPNFKIKMIPKPNSGDSPLEVKFIGLAEGEGNHTFVWEIEGQKINGKEINYVFEKPGVYDVKLTVTDDKGNILVTHKKIIVGGDIKKDLKVEVVANPISGKSPLESGFEASVKNNNGNIKYTWYIEGQKFDGQRIKYLFTKPGKYKVVVVAEDNNGKKGQEKVIIEVNEKQVEKIKIKLTANPMIAKVNTNIDFFTEVSGGNGNYKYSWYIDGGVLNRNNSKLKYFFPKPGTYTVKLKVTDDNGNIGTKEIIIKIIPKDHDIENPISLAINASTLSGQIPLPVKFKAILGGDNDNNYDYLWNLGGVEKTGKNVDHSFKNPGIKTIKLTAKNKITGFTTVTVIKVKVTDKDTDGDGIPDKDDPDDDNDGILDKDDPDDDGDGIPDNIDPDDDNEGILDKDDPDDDGDGIPNKDDPDDDGDGIPDKDDPDHPDNKKPPAKPSIPPITYIPIDTDGDGVPDIDDDCVFVPGEIINDGCPIMGVHCGVNCNCGPGYQCNIMDETICAKEGICIPDNRCKKDCSCPQEGYVCDMQQGGGSCDMAGICIKKDSCLDEMNGGVGIFGNAICDMCPCEVSADFSSDIRICDIIFPAITSPNSSEIYSKGKNWFIK